MAESLINFRRFLSSVSACHFFLSSSYFEMSGAAPLAARSPILDFACSAAVTVFFMPAAASSEESLELSSQFTSASIPMVRSALAAPTPVAIISPLMAVLKIVVLTAAAKAPLPSSCSATAISTVAMRAAARTLFKPETTTRKELVASVTRPRRPISPLRALLTVPIAVTAMPI